MTRTDWFLFVAFLVTMTFVAAWVLKGLTDV